MRFIFLIFFSITTLISSELDITAKLMPRIILQSSLADKSKDINIAIAYTPNVMSRALELKRLVSTTAKAHTVKTVLVDVSKKNYSLDNYQALYICELEESNLQRLLKNTRKKQIITFAKNSNQFVKGVMFFIESKRKINIYLNTKSAELANIGFNSTLLKYVKTYDKK